MGKREKARVGYTGLLTYVALLTEQSSMVAPCLGNDEQMQGVWKSFCSRVMIGRPFILSPKHQHPFRLIQCGHPRCLGLKIKGKSLVRWRWVGYRTADSGSDGDEGCVGMRKHIW